MEDIQIILASGSPRRRELLGQIGLDPVIFVSNAEEDLDTEDPKKMVLELSRRKCLDVAGKLLPEKTEQTRIVLGADTVVSINGRILGKPQNEEDAERMLKLLSGKAHEVFTGVYMAKIGNGSILAEEGFAEETKVFVGELSRKEILEYIATGEPMDKAGSYGIQGVFAKHVEKIDGDYFNVVGLPLYAVYQALKRLKNEL